MHLGLDEVAGAAAIQTEIYGDWFRDPWTWPEFSWVRRQPAAMPWTELLNRDKAGISPRWEPYFEPVLVPKSLLGTRPSVVMSPDTRLLYQCAALASATALHQYLPPWVFGWRVRGDKPPSSKNDREWVTYLQHFDSLPLEEHGLRLDLASFFASVDHEKAADLCYERVGRNAATQIIEHVVVAHNNLASHSGLPQRSMASSVIANAYLRPLDDLLSLGIRKGRLSGATRWMDDIHATGTESALYEANVELQYRARQLGLELNSAKSKLAPAAEIHGEVERPAVRAQPRRRNPAASAVDESKLLALRREQLRSIEDEVLDDPSRHSRSTFKSLLRALRDVAEFGRNRDWISCAHRLPQLADVLSRYFRDCGRQIGQPFWEEYTDWLNKMVGTSWFTLPWVCAQLFSSVPSYAASDAVCEHYESWLSHSSDLQLLSLAVQRMANVDPESLRDIVRARVDYVSSPLILRAFALGLTSAGESTGLVKSILDRDRRNVLLALALESSGWRPARVAADFDAVDLKRA